MRSILSLWVTSSALTAVSVSSVCLSPRRAARWLSRIASARALEAVTVIEIKADQLNSLFDRHAHIGFVIMKQLAEVIASRLRHTREVCEGILVEE